MGKNKAKDWAQLCGSSNGTMSMVPESMIKETESFMKESDEYMEKAKEFDKLAASFDVKAKNFWHKMRLALEADGVEDIWAKNIGFNSDAKKEGMKVINLIQSSGGPMQM